MRARAAITLLLLVAGSCRSTGPVDPAVRRDLDQARERWQTLAPREYTFESRQIYFFGPPAMYLWTEVHVRNDSVVGARPLDVVPIGFEPAPLDTWPTVPRLFSNIEALLRDGSTQEVVTTFDSTFGYPLSIEQRCRPGMLDCGITIFSRNLKVIR